MTDEPGRGQRQDADLAGGGQAEVYLTLPEVAARLSAIFSASLDLIGVLLPPTSAVIDPGMPSGHAPPAEIASRIRRSALRQPLLSADDGDVVRRYGPARFVKFPGDPGQVEPAPYIFLRFQSGPRAEVGVNGCEIEDVLEILIARFEHFQRGPCPCAENAVAIEHLVRAWQAILARTVDRHRRGVEGTARP